MAPPSPSAATAISDLHPDVLTQILLRLDGPSLASTACASAQFRSLTANPGLWHTLLTANWPSLRHYDRPNHCRSFFSDAFLFPDPTAVVTTPTTRPRELVSAVDLFHDNIPIFSRIVETKAMTPWFLGSPFHVDVLERKDPPLPLLHQSPEDLRLSWIVIDPSSGRAVNVSSRRPVSVYRDWHSREMEVKFATVLGGGKAAAVAVVRCGGEDGLEVKELRMAVEDLDGKCLNGKESVEVLKEAMEGRKVGMGREIGFDAAAAAAEAYRRFERRKMERKEKQVNKEWKVDMCYAIAGVSLFFVSLGAMAFR